jgi:hypothetical protein
MPPMIIIGIPIIKPIIVKHARPPKITSSKPIVFLRNLTDRANTIRMTAMSKINHSPKLFIAKTI